MGKKLQGIKMPGRTGSEGNSISLEIEVSLPMPATRSRERAVPECRPEDKIEAAMELIESGHESGDEWKYLRWVNNSLMKKYDKGSIGKRELAILKKIQPIMEKYGQLDPEGVKQNAALHSTATGAEEK